MSRNEFYRMVKKQPNGCWLWKGKCNYGQGYGSCKKKDEQSGRATWLAFKLFKGKIPFNLHVLHTCDNPPCVRPAHLFLGTNADNQKDKVRKGRHKGGMPPGEGCFWAKLTEAKVRRIRKEYIPHIVSCDKLARKYGVNQPAIFRIVKRITWRNVV